MGAHVRAKSKDQGSEVVVGLPCAEAAASAPVAPVPERKGVATMPRTPAFVRIDTPLEGVELPNRSLRVRGDALGPFVNVPVVGDIRLPVDVTVTVTDAEPSSRIIQNVNGDGWTADFTITSAGGKTIRAEFTAVSGATFYDERGIVAPEDPDTEPPVLTIDTRPGDKVMNKRPFVVAFSGEVEDRPTGPGQSDITDLEYSTRGASGPFSPVSNAPRGRPSGSWHQRITFPSLGQHTVHFRAEDAAGYRSHPVGLTVNLVDSSGPVLVVSEPRDDPFTVTLGVQGAVVEVAGSASDAVSGVASVQWSLDGGDPRDAIEVSGGWSSWRFSVEIPPSEPGRHRVDIIARDGADLLTTQSLFIDAAVPFELEEISYAGYLQDLISFARDRVRFVDGTEDRIDPAVLAQTFYQPYDRLLLTEHHALANRPVSQVRIAIEALRHLSSIWFSPTSYARTVYQTLLRNIGTSYADLRLSYRSNAETRARLASQLGIPVDKLPRLLFDPDDMDEANLERVFGLADTTRGDPSDSRDRGDPVFFDEMQAELLAWRRDKLLADWLAQDRAALPDSDEFEPEVLEPAIDPDLLSPDDFKAFVSEIAEGDAAYHMLFESRRDWVSGTHEAMMRKSGPDHRRAFSAIIRVVYDDASYHDIFPEDEEDGIADIILIIYRDFHNGDDIEPLLFRLGLTASEFVGLANIALSVNGEVLPEEWTALCDILVQVLKRRLFLDWAREENDLGVTLGPQFFTQSTTRPAVNQWRAGARRRRVWEKKRDARFKQYESLEQTHQALIADTEATVLPMLRDTLISMINPGGVPNAEIADWLTQRLSISFRYDGGQRLSRLEQAVETLQDALQALRTGRLATAMPVPLAPPPPQWELKLVAEGDNRYSETDFDDEWLWMGRYATWRGAMSVFLYPENYLLPTLRNRSSWTQAFTELVDNLRRVPRLTPTQAEELAARYMATLRRQPANDEEVGDGIGVDEFPAERTLTSQVTKAQLEARYDWSREDLDRQDLIDLNLGSDDFPNNGKYLLEYYFFVPILIAQTLQRNGHYRAALDWYQLVYAYDLAAGKRKVFYGLEVEESKSTVFQRIPGWLIRGRLDVFRIAHDRANSATAFTINAIARCFNTYADAEFTRETNTSIPAAHRLYMTALDLLDLLPPPAQPVAHFPFESEDTVTTDVSGNGLVATLDGGVGTHWLSDARRGGALALSNPSSSFVIAPSSLLRLGENGADYSICFWIYLLHPSHSNDRHDRIVFTRRIETATEWPVIWVYGDLQGNYRMLCRFRVGYTEIVFGGRSRDSNAEMAPHIISKA